MGFEKWFADLERLESHLGLPSGFIEGLMKEDDWSFVIKGHALLEAAVSRLLVERSDARLEPVFARLQLGGGRTGKLSFVNALELLPPADVQLLQWLGELRNRLVHDPKQFGFRLDEYAQNLLASDRRNLVHRLAEVVEFEGDATVMAEYEASFVERPKPILGFAILAVLAHTLFGIEPAEKDRASELAAKGTTRIILALAIAIGLGHGISKRAQAESAALG